MHLKQTTKLNKNQWH